MDFSNTAAIPHLASRVLLFTRIAALEVYCTGDGGVYSGMIAELPAGAEIEICGRGFNSRTLLTRWERKNYYVYLQDLEHQIREVGG